MVHTLPHASALPHQITVQDIMDLGIEPFKILINFRVSFRLLYPLCSPRKTFSTRANTASQSRTAYLLTLYSRELAHTMRIKKNSYDIQTQKMFGSSLLN
jgi:hypothetical protein